MREIKFRGKRVDNGGWMDGYFHRGMMSGYTYIDGTEVISDTVGQYTGRKDKNGVEIYEGDILEGLGYVVWGDIDCRYLIDIIGEKYEVFFDELSQNELKVISNIHDNPELKREPCEWCDGNVSKYFGVNWYDFTTSNTEARPKAKFCPFCGRELDWEE